MNKFFKYLFYIFKHKYYVFIAGLKVGAPIFRLIIHDWSKFLPCEFIPYMNYFYGKFYTDNDIRRFKMIFGQDIPNKYNQKYWSNRFDYAWNTHQKSNKHHHQYWVLRNDSGSIVALDMPDKYIREMVSDWAGAGKAITGKWEVKLWYETAKSRMLLSDNTRRKVEQLLHIYF